MSMLATDLGALVEELWAMVVGTTLAPDPGGVAGPGDLAAAIDLRGDRQATLTVVCDASLASNLAATFFAGAPAGSDDARAALHEFVNMVAGHVAAAVGGVVRITLPVEASPLPADEARNATDVGWTCGAGRLRVRLEWTAVSPS